MRVLPNMTVFSPVDAVETRQMVREMVCIKGLCYIRINRNGLPVLLDDNEKYTIGQARIMREGKDLTVFATG